MPDTTRRARQALLLLLCLCCAAGAPAQHTGPEKLGPAINSAQSEERPVLSPDGHILYFYRRDNRQHNLWYAEQKQGIWQAARPLEALESELDEAVSAAGRQWLILQVSSPGTTGWDFYMVNRLPGGKWGQPVNMGPHINSPAWEGHGCLSDDGKAFLFCSQRQGNNDIYVSLWQNQAWGPAIPLGPPVNSPDMEYTPFLYHNTLYFSSQGQHPNYGAWDVYKSRRLSDSSWTQWSAPTNAGPLLNGPGKDYGYIIDPEGRYAYYAHEGDIYRLFLSDTLAADSAPGPAAIAKDSSFRLENIFFLQSSPELLPGSRPALERLVSWLQLHPGLRIHIVGHTDNRGPAGANLLLSQQRAKAIAVFLIQQGIAPERLQHTGMGEKQPLADNGSQAGREQNRRVEIHIKSAY